MTSSLRSLNSDTWIQVMYPITFKFLNRKVIENILGYRIHCLYKDFSIYDVIIYLVVSFLSV